MNDQDMLVSLCVADIVVQQFHKDHPNIVELFNRSDNATTYLANGALNNICKKYDIYLVRLDYSEPQKGKDACDREAAIAKSYHKAYIASGCSVLNAHDLKKALKYQGGPKNTKICVIHIDKEASTIKNVQKIKNISSYHSIEFHDTYFTLWKYYDIGSGLRMNKNNTELEANIEIISGFDDLFEETALSHRKESAKFHYFCSEELCGESFETIHDLNIHMTAGRHNYIIEKSASDKYKIYYKNRAISASNNCELQNVSRTESTTKSYFNFGWALPQLRKNKRLNPKSKQFVIEKFTDGAKKGRKFDPAQIHDAMKNSKK